MRIVLTGATGLLGSNLLLEWIKNYLTRLDKLEVFLLGRQKVDKALENRIYELVAGTEGLEYLQAFSQRRGIEDFLEKNVRCVDYDLSLPNLGLSDVDLEVLQSKPIDFFFHIASSTDFRNTPLVDKSLEAIIVEGTRKVLSLVDSCEVKEFVYVGTAYSCGYKGGVLAPDVIDFNVKFRNPYEKRKLQAEVLVREFCQHKKLRFRVFRPSTICGRLIESPDGATTKFDVFYSWLAFFLRLKLKSGILKEDLYTTPFKMSLRVVSRSDAGLNIISADCAAKIMYQVCIQNDSGSAYYLTSPQESPHRDYMLWMMDFLQIKEASFVETQPSDLNDIESFYYKTVGNIFSPYAASDAMLFDVSNLSTVMSRACLKYPAINKEDFIKLMGYAKLYNFGLGVK